VASAEAGAAFGNPALYMEKYIEKPRHIEIQILGDHLGNYVHLGERECSIQMRYQKLIEESPSSFVDETLREKLGSTAIRIAKAFEYTNAGTMEFLVDKDKNSLLHGGECKGPGGTSGH
jgi:acetyl-CoA carboxylase, biotin carboxylase subunit